MSLLRKNIFILLLMQGANYLIPLVTFPYLTRVLGVSQFGSYAFILTLSQYFILFTDFGFNLSATRRIAQANNDKSIITYVFWSTLTAKILIGLVCSIVIIFFSWWTRQDSAYNGIIFILFTVLGSIFTPVWLFQGIERISILTSVTILSKALAIPLIMFFVKTNNDAHIAILIQGLVSSFIAFSSLIIVYRMGCIAKIRISISAAINQLKDSSPLFVSSIAISLYTMSTPLILQMVSNSYEIGLYSAADRIRGAFIGLFLVVGNALYPRVNNLFVTDKPAMYSLLRKVIILKSFFSITLIIFLWFFSSQLVSFILGADFVDSICIIKIMSVQFFTVLISISMANYLLLPFGYRKEYMLLPIFTCTLHVVICFILAKKYGAIGGALSVTLVETMSMFILIYVTYRKGLLSALFFNTKSQL
ncbi:flippase [Aeromonas veronii]|uniref:flippase n=1 Tax=Aeromonas veronii TaxID=654 RepID=UPI002245F61A|nr:flippase [Aeromonas veronii]MCX0436606.1 flippase [Aeromonas veronii]